MREREKREKERSGQEWKRRERRRHDGEKWRGRVGGKARGGGNGE